MPSERLSPFEDLVTATITDMYLNWGLFLRTSAWSPTCGMGLCLSIGVCASGTISGNVIQDLGWQWTYKLGGYLFLTSNCNNIFVGNHVPLLYFFCPETCYKRSADLNIYLGIANHAQELEAELKEVELTSEKESDDGNIQEKNASQLEAQLVNQHDANERPWAKWEELRLWRGVESEDKFLMIIVRILWFPQVWYPFITCGLWTSWLIVLQSVAALIFGAPPYDFTVGNIGLLRIAGLITSILGLFSGTINDYLCKFIARRNNGIYEAEATYLPISTRRLTVAPFGLNCVDICIRNNWFLWFWDLIARPTPLDQTSYVPISTWFRTRISEHCGVWTYHGLSSRSFP